MWLLEEEYYEERYRARIVKKLIMKAKELGFDLIKIAALKTET